MDDSRLQEKTQKASRLVFIDHLRVFMIILVVLHHVAAVYGAGTEFYYVEPPFTDPTAFNLLLAFMLINQAWFMGAFFLIAGYFTPGSYDRKGPLSYLKDRLLRLGVPLALFFFLLNPLSSAGFFFMPVELTGITTPLSFDALFPDFFGLGPLWFVAMLLVFCIGYALWRWLTRSHSDSTLNRSSSPSYLRVGVFILVLAGISFLMRMVVPIGEEVRGFPTLAYLPQYLSFFVVGVVAYRKNWFQEIPDALGLIGFVAAALVGIVVFPYLYSGRWFTLEVSESLGLVMGDGSWQSAVYALFDSVFAVGMCLGLIMFFRKFQNQQSQLGRFLSQHSYAVYVFHIPIIVYLAYALRELELASLLKFAVVSLIVIPACFIVAFIVRKIPMVSKIM
jgi:peptidoglycan/LPS O-acetylase OafA/YrhL